MAQLVAAYGAMDSSVRRVVMNRQAFGKVARGKTPKRIVHLEDENNKSGAFDGSIGFPPGCVPCKMSMAWIKTNAAHPVLTSSLPLLSSSTFLIEDPGVFLVSFVNRKALDSLNSQTKCNTLLRCCHGTRLYTYHP